MIIMIRIMALLALIIFCTQSNGELVTCQAGVDCNCDPLVSGEPCTLTCGTLVCKGQNIVCRAGDECTINCNGRRACRNSKITCPAGNICTLYCTDHKAACKTPTFTMDNTLAFDCIEVSGGLCGDAPAPFTQSPTLYPTTPSIPPTLVPSETPTLFPSFNPSTTPSKAPTRSPSAFPSLFPSFQPTNTPSKSPTYIPSQIPTLTPTLLPTITPTLSPSFVPSTNPTQIPSNTPVASPTLSPTTATPTTYPTLSPSHAPSTMAPTNVPSVSPTNIPTITPSHEPTIIPSYIPTSPSETPTAIPTKFGGTPSPINQPSAYPTQYPSHLPSASPTENPSTYPTDIPTNTPSHDPTMSPSHVPTSVSATPTTAPTKFGATRPPTNDPSTNPTKYPTRSPSLLPTDTPSIYPTPMPTIAPSQDPTMVPSYVPTQGTETPTSIPTKFGDTRSPTNDPTTYPTEYPTRLPSLSPTAIPSAYPTDTPTHTPSHDPTRTPSYVPTEIGATRSPTNDPGPSTYPTMYPNTLSTALDGLTTSDLFSSSESISSNTMTSENTDDLPPNRRNNDSIVQAINGSGGGLMMLMLIIGVLALVIICVCFGISYYIRTTVTKKVDLALSVSNILNDVKPTYKRNREQLKSMSSTYKIRRYGDKSIASVSGDMDFVGGHQIVLSQSTVASPMSPSAVSPVSPVSPVSVQRLRSGVELQRVVSGTGTVCRLSLKDLDTELPSDTDESDDDDADGAPPTTQLQAQPQSVYEEAPVEAASNTTDYILNYLGMIDTPGDPDLFTEFDDMKVSDSTAFDENEDAKVTEPEVEPKVVPSGWNILEEYKEAVRRGSEYEHKPYNSAGINAIKESVVRRISNTFNKELVEDDSDEENLATGQLPQINEHQANNDLNQQRPQLTDYKTDDYFQRPRGVSMDISEMRESGTINTMDMFEIDDESMIVSLSRDDTNTMDARSPPRLGIIRQNTESFHRKMTIDVLSSSYLMDGVLNDIGSMK
eukprot:291287_1